MKACTNWTRHWKFIHHSSNSTSKVCGNSSKTVTPPTQHQQRLKMQAMGWAIKDYTHCAKPWKSIRHWQCWTWVVSSSSNAKRNSGVSWPSTIKTGNEMSAQRVCALGEALKANTTLITLNLAGKRKAVTNQTTKAVICASKTAVDRKQLLWWQCKGVGLHATDARAADNTGPEL